MGKLDSENTPNVDVNVDIPVDGSNASLNEPAGPEKINLPDIGTFHLLVNIPVQRGKK
jgi:hypothetical protein